MVQQRRKYSDEYKAAAVERFYEPGATDLNGPLFAGGPKVSKDGAYGKK